MHKRVKKQIEIILKSTLPKKGTPGDVIKVVPGEANHLIRLGVGIPYIGNEKIVEEKKREWEAKDKLTKESNQKTIDQINQLSSITIKRQSGFGGSLYGTVSAKDIADELELHSINVQKRFIILNPIKVIGDYKAKIVLGEGETQLKITVESL